VLSSSIKSKIEGGLLGIVIFTVKIGF